LFLDFFYFFSGFVIQCFKLIKGIYSFSGIQMHVVWKQRAVNWLHVQRAPQWLLLLCFVTLQEKEELFLELLHALVRARKLFKRRCRVLFSYLHIGRSETSSESDQPINTV